MMQANLFEKTLQKLEENGKSIADIISVQGRDFAIELSDFIDLAKETYYGIGYGAAEIAIDLTIIGKDWYMTRGEYDGAEWWELHQTPKILTNKKKVKALKGDLWPLLEEFVK